MSESAGHRDAYPPIGSLAAIGDGHSLALLGPDAAVEFYCPGRFDAPAVVFPLLDRRRGGRLRIGPVDPAGRPLPCRLRHLPGSAVLEAEWSTDHGRARMRVAMAWPRPAHGQEILWLIEGLEGLLDVEAVLAPQPGFAREHTHLSVDRNLASATTADLSLLLATAGVGLRPTGTAAGRATLRAGHRFAGRLVASTIAPSFLSAAPEEVARTLAATDAGWRDWTSTIRYDGPRPDTVLRSAIALKQLIYQPTGAVVAAGTTSLPERIGGVRNWDYRYTWLRDASFTLNALYQLGCTREAARYARWLCRTVAGSALPLRVLYRVDGSTDIPEHALPELEGYRGSRPVRVGNAAETQLQLDSYGELLDCLTICEVLGDEVMPGVAPLRPPR